MIDSVFELVNKTASNSLFMFLFCNFIIILILLGHSKPASLDYSNPGSQETMLISDPVLSSKSGFERSVLMSESVLSPQPGFQKSQSIISTKPGSQRSELISDTVLSPKPGFEKSESIISSNSKPGFQKSESAPSSKSQSQSVLISDSVLSSKPGFEKRVSISQPIAVTTKPGLQEPVMISKSALSSKPAITEQFRTSKPGLRKMSSGLKPGSDFSEKDEKGIMKKESLLEVETESEVECVLRRRVEEFIRKVNTQWKSENIKTDHSFVYNYYGKNAL